MPEELYILYKKIRNRQNIEKAFIIWLCYHCVECPTLLEVEICIAPKTIITGKEDTFQDTGIIAAHDIITIQILAGQTSAYTSPGIGK